MDCVLTKKSNYFDRCPTNFAILLIKVEGLEGHVNKARKNISSTALLNILVFARLQQGMSDQGS